MALLDILISDVEEFSFSGSQTIKLLARYVDVVALADVSDVQMYTEEWKEFRVNLKAMLTDAEARARKENDIAEDDGFIMEPYLEGDSIVYSYDGFGLAAVTIPRHLKESAK